MKRIINLLSVINVYAAEVKETGPGSGGGKTIKDIFGTIEPPEQLKKLVEKDPTGAGGISLFLSNLVALIYVAAAVMLLFMLLWGAWDWMTSGGDKEKLAAARDKLLHALVGIGLFAAAFAIIRVIETAFGFKITP